MSLARYVGTHAVANGDPRLGEKLFEAMERSTAAQVRDAMEKFLVAAPKVVVIQRPGGKPGSPTNGGGAANDSVVGGQTP